MTAQRPERALFICPDYLSHFYPMSAIAEECARRGMSVTVATGPGLEARVESLGFTYTRLILGPGSNTGVLRTQEQSGQERAHMEAFFDATKAGPIETLLYQSAAREHDMLWQPEEVHATLSDLMYREAPDYIVVDQLAFAATLALHTLQIPFASYLPANPSSLPGGTELFGLPARLPSGIEVNTRAWSHLRQVCESTDVRFTDQFNAVVRRLAPNVPPVSSAFRHTSPWLTLLNYPAALGQYRSNQIPAQAHFIGSSIRTEPRDDAFENALRTLDPARPTVYVSLGTFLSAREDVLRSIAAAIQRTGAQCIMATGSAGLHLEASLPGGWIVRSVLPQLAALRHADLVVSHGGNNTVTEAMTLGVPALVAPFSSDQFDSAADLEAAHLGAVFDPNTIDEELLAMQIGTLLSDRSLHGRAKDLSVSLRAHPGPQIAVDLLRGVFHGKHQQAHAVTA